MYPDLVGATCFQLTLDEGHISKPFKNLIVRDCFFAVIAIRVRVEQFAQPLMPSNVCHNCSPVLHKITPGNSYIMSLHSMIEELFCKTGYSSFSLCQYHESTRILIYTVNESESGEHVFVQCAVLL